MGILFDLICELINFSTEYFVEQQKINRTPAALGIINLDYCDRTFGTSPCLATGTPCYNTWPTCKYPSAYATSAGKDYKFCLKDNPTPLPGQIIRPYIEKISYLGQEILQTEAVTLNQKMSITLADEPDSDVGIDPYRVSPTQRSAPGGTANVVAAGTFWTKLKARNSNYKNRRITVKKGFVAPGFSEADYQTYFVGVLENIEIDGQGKVRITAKGLLNLTNVDLPKKTDGRLSAEISAAATSFNLAAWTGVDRSVDPPMSQYASSGYLKIDTEIVSYSSASLVNGITTFSGVSRGLYNGDGWFQAATHSADTQVQQVEILDGNPIDLIHTLLNKAGISDADIDVAKFAFERDNWFPGVQFRGVLHEPKKIKEYLKELREQTLTSLWQADDQKITIRSMNPNFPGQAYTQIKDAENIIFQSRHIDDREALRITRVPIYYDLFAGKSGGSSEDFARAAVAIDADAEAASNYNEIRWRDPIYSRWLRSSLVGNDYVRILATRITRRFRDGAKNITFDMELKDETLALGDIFELVTADIVDFDGNARTVRYQVVKKEQQSRGRIRYTAVDTKLKAKYAFIAPAGTPDYITYSAGSGAVSTSGVNATFSVAHGLSIGNYVKLMSGAQSGQARKVVDVPTSATATLESAFSADQTAQSWNKGVLATAAQREYAFVSNSSGKMSNGDEGYLII